MFVICLVSMDSVGKDEHLDTEIVKIGEIASYCQFK